LAGCVDLPYLCTLKTEKSKQKKMEKTIIKASIANIDNIREQISGIFVEGFYQWLQNLSKDKTKLQQAFAHMFDLEKFHVNINPDTNEVMSIAALNDGKQSPVKITPRIFRKHLGLIRGSIAAKILRKMFENTNYPFEIERNMGSIEFVGTNPNYLRRQAAYNLLKNMIDNSAYQSLVLEVACNNEKAINLYTKLGFYEYKKIPNKYSKQAGFDHLIYLRLEK
jgi:ribosomal protein S18 acetylase RimI-like enzyme